jgi:hypothetical protein
MRLLKPGTVSITVSYLIYLFFTRVGVVLDLVSQVRDVVLVMCIFSSGKPQGVGILGRGVYGEGDGKWGDKFTSNLGARWTGSYHSKEGSK